MKENYLKIGELAALKGVSVKSLRYYDRIGILKPAYIDPETGYRYYKQEQIMLLDIILLCITFDIPLKSLKDYYEGGRTRPDLKNIIADGMEQAKIKMREAEKRMKLSEDLLEQIERIGSAAARDSDKREDAGFYENRFPERTLLVMKWNEETDSGSTYMKRISEMTAAARRADMTILTQQGIINDLETGRMGVFLAVLPAEPESAGPVVTKPDSGSACALVNVPAGTYKCMIMREKDTGRMHEIMKEAGIRARYTLWLNTDIYDYCLVREERQLEVQFFDSLNVAYRTFAIK